MNQLRGILFYILITVFAAPTQNFDIYHFQEPLSISFEKTSLALAALRDTQDSEELPTLAFNTLDSEPLGVERTLPSAAPVGPRYVVFEDGITVSKDDILLVQKQINKDRVLASLSENLSPQQMNRLVLAADVDQIVSEDWSQPNLDSEIQKHLWQESVQALEEESSVAVETSTEPFNQLALELDTQKKPTIIISSGKMLPPSAPKDTFLPANLIASNDRAPSPPEQEKGATDKFVATTKSVPTVPAAQILKGTFEFTDGLGFLFGQHDLKLIHVVDGAVLSEGFVNWSSASFEIPIEIMKGELKAIIIDSDGFMVGRGSIPLDGLPTDTYELSGFHIPIAPKYNGLVIQTISAYSFDNYIEKAANIKISDPYEAHIYKSDLEGKFENKLVKNGSTQVLQFSGAGNWSTTKYIEAGEKTSVPIFEDSMVSALLETIKEQGYQQGQVGNHGIIWGKIKNFKNAEGVQVKLTDETAFGPAYLNHAYLPQRNLLSTTKNGYFIFAGVKPGIHSLSFEYQGKSFQRTIEVFRQNISYIDVQLDTTIEQTITFETQEKKSEASLEVFIPGAKVTQAPSNPLKAKIVKSSAYNIIEFKERGSSIVYRANIPTSEDNIRLQYLEPAILNKIINWKEVSNITIGFIKPGEFSGLFLNKKELSANQMMYFDLNGKIILNDKINLMWDQIAGFIVFNIAEGSNSLQIFDDQGIVSQYELLIGSDIVHILPQISSY